mmetsp:Transcript_7534/g.22007  ORF Transcript_7534/g.22007 Transcript_7534/m.22007 type:complete len:85 (-) Transcript_7534:509-763(-)
MALMIRVEILVAIVAIVFLDSHDYDDYDYDPHLLGVEIQITATPHSPGDVGAIQQHDPSGHDRIVCRTAIPSNCKSKRFGVWLG